jgi:hypothetical protein
MNSVDELVLFVIKTEAGCTPREVAELLDYSYDYVVRSFKRLRLANFIKIEKDSYHILVQEPEINFGDLDVLENDLIVDVKESYYDFWGQDWD